MTKVTIEIWLEGEEIKVQGTVEPKLTADQQVFNTVELVGLYMQNNMGKILSDAVAWARTPDEVEDAMVKTSSIILPGAQL